MRFPLTFCWSISPGNIIDSILTKLLKIPLCDNLLQIEMPRTPLTEILNDFRSYRPGNHREFLEEVRGCARKTGLKQYALEDRFSAALYLRALDQVRDFRWRHWCFTREYILKRTSHPTATGGSPIVTVSKCPFFKLPRLNFTLIMLLQWLPNQIQAVLSQMTDVSSHCISISGTNDIMETVRSQQESLRKEVAKYCGERGVAM